MDVQVFESIPHEIRAFRYAGEKLPWVHHVFNSCRFASIEWVDGCTDDNENSGSFLLYFGDWVVVDEGGRPIRIIDEGDFPEFYRLRPNQA